MSSTNSSQGYLDSALYYNKRAVVIAEKQQHPHNIAISKQNASIIYYRQGKLDKALEINLEVADIFLGNDNYAAYCNTLSNIGTLYRVTGKITEALNTYHKLVSVSIEKGYLIE